METNNQRKAAFLWWLFESEFANETENIPKLENMGPQQETDMLRLQISGIKVATYTDIDRIDRHHLSSQPMTRPCLYHVCSLPPRCSSWGFSPDRRDGPQASSQAVRLSTCRDSFFSLKNMLNLSTTISINKSMEEITHQDYSWFMAFFYAWFFHVCRVCHVYSGLAPPWPRLRCLFFQVR